MIVKDDSEFDSLKRGVNSCVNYVDEVNITATNKPCHKIEKWCKKHGYKYSFFKWINDFAAARNFNFDQASYNQFWIDADDVVLNPEKLREIGELLENDKCDWVNLEYIYEKDAQGRVVMRHWKPRLTRKGTGKWEKSVHECYNPTTNVIQCIDENVKIDHNTEKGHTDSSGKRNLTILLEEFNRDGEKTDPRTLYYLGNTLMSLDKPAEAAVFYKEHIKKCGWPEEKYFSMHYLAHCLKWIEKYDEAINVSLEATKVFPNWNLAYFDIAEFYSIKEDYKRSIDWTLTGLMKEKPDSKQYFVNDTDYTLYPMGRLAEAYMQTGEYEKALEIAVRLNKENPNDPLCKELLKTAKEVYKTEKFVENFVDVVGVVRDKDRISAIKMFEALPSPLDEDYRIQTARQMIVPPVTWPKKSIVFYCHGGNEDWAYPSLFTGLGGSETQVIRIGEELVKKGYKVVVYCRCGALRGEYNGIEYRPYYHFNLKDYFDTLIIWRYPGFADTELHYNKLYIWLHDIVSDGHFNQRIIDKVDKVFFLSKWHRNNAPIVPDEKVFITNNGIMPENFKESEKRPNSLVWTSSYDRGLVTLGLDILPLIEKEIPDVTLDVCYGSANLEKEMDRFPHLKEIYDKCQIIFSKPNVKHHGRIGQQKVAELQMNSMIHAYASEFGETNCISTQQAQAANCYVVTTPQAGAVPEYLKFGELIDGNGIYTDKDQQQRYADAVIKYLKNPKLMTEDKRKEVADSFSVREVADQWEKLLSA